MKLRLTEHVIMMDAFILGIGGGFDPKVPQQMYF